MFSRLFTIFAAVLVVLAVVSETKQNGTCTSHRDTIRSRSNLSGRPYELLIPSDGLTGHAGIEVTIVEADLGRCAPMVCHVGA
jgi:hypothetical protein